ncbi:MAG: hypothetical protein P8Y00_11100, partial [Deltaproteobacteria bacterium]
PSLQVRVHSVILKRSMPVFHAGPLALLLHFIKAKRNAETELQMSKKEKRFLSTAEVGGLLGVTRQTVRNWFVN